MKPIQIIVPGGLNTDFVAQGVRKLAGKGELVTGKELKIGPGGKSRNVAQMIATLTGPGKVAMIGRTTKDPFGLYRVPMDALKDAGVNTAYVEVLEFTGTFPGIALIPVDEEGNNQIYLLPGVNSGFSPAGIDAAEKLFQAAGSSGMLALSLELPIETALRAMDQAVKHGLRIILDPGGIEPGADHGRLLSKDIFLLKPNEYEAEILSGVTVTDLKSAGKAASLLMQKGPQNVLITAGVDGAYLFTPEAGQHIPVPDIASSSGEKDETGCGDQAMAAICAMIAEGKDVAEAARLGIAAGTLQFHKSGIVPVTSMELTSFLK